MTFNRKRARNRFISLTPLIDVIFMLLLFFMLATSFQQWRSLDINPTGRNPAAGQRATQHQVLRVYPGRLELAGRTVTMDEIARIMREQTPRGAPALLLQASADLRLQRLVSVIDAVNEMTTEINADINPQRVSGNERMPIVMLSIDE